MPADPDRQERPRVVSGEYGGYAYKKSGPDRQERIEFTGARPVVAEGGRIGVVTCLACGAALSMDPADDFDPRELHRRWHEENDA